MFLPIILLLVEPSRRTWAPARGVQLHALVRGHGPSSPSARGGRRNRIRALVLYPMNALVEDQLVRLRRALDSPAARPGWNTGRATGSTSGATPARHRFWLRRHCIAGSPSCAGSSVRGARHVRAVELDRTNRSPMVANDAYYLQSLDGAEMRAVGYAGRSPGHPHHELLDAQRDAHARAGRPLLRSDSRVAGRGPVAQVHIVVDELHLYRGTAGTEVAYLLRRLWRRLGLTDRPEQLGSSLPVLRSRPMHRTYLGFSLAMPTHSG